MKVHVEGEKSVVLRRTVLLPVRIAVLNRIVLNPLRIAVQKRRDLLLLKSVLLKKTVYRISLKLTMVASWSWKPVGELQTGWLAGWSGGPIMARRSLKGDYR